MKNVAINTALSIEQTAKYYKHISYISVQVLAKACATMNSHHKLKESLALRQKRVTVVHLRALRILKGTVCVRTWVYTNQ